MSYIDDLDILFDSDISLRRNPYKYIAESTSLDKSIPNPDDVEIRHIGNDPAAISEAFEIFAAAFPQYDFGEVRGFIMSAVNWDKSIKAIYYGRAIGMYLVGDRHLFEVIKDEKATPTDDLSHYANKVGVEGVALAVIPEAQKMGVGKKLKAALLNMVAADYIFGLQYKNLNNLQHWLKSRRIVAQSSGDEAVYITLQDL